MMGFSQPTLASGKLIKGKQDFFSNSPSSHSYPDIQIEFSSPHFTTFLKRF